MWFVENISVTIHDSINRNRLTIIGINKIHFFGITGIRSARKSRFVLKFMFRDSSGICRRIQLQRNFTRKLGLALLLKSNGDGELTLKVLRTLGSVLRWDILPREPSNVALADALTNIHVAAAILFLLSMVKLYRGSVRNCRFKPYLYCKVKNKQNMKKYSSLSERKLRWFFIVNWKLRTDKREKKNPSFYLKDPYSSTPP